MMLENIKDKNPKNNDGWTPLHTAAEKGHEGIYKMIMDEVQEKNPKSNDRIEHAMRKGSHVTIVI